MRASRRASFPFAVTLFSLLLLVVPGVAWADALDAAARQLAARISAALPPREAVVLDLRNLSSLAAVDVAAARRALEAGLEAHGVPLAAGSAAHVEVRVTFSENLEGYLWVAEIRRGATPAVVMVSLPRSAVASAERAEPALVLQRELVWGQERQILDLALLDAGAAKQRMAVLEPGQLSLYQWRNSGWEPRQAFPVAAGRPWPRDLRGKLYRQRLGPSDLLLVFLPGIDCRLPLEGNAPLADLACGPGDTDSLGFPFFRGEELAGGAKLAPTGNFFGPEVRSGGWRGSVGPFFSLTVLPEGSGGALLISAGVDGLVHIYDQASRAMATVPGWGSDVSSIKTNCGSGWQVLATRPGDWTQPDAVGAYEIRDGVAVGATPALEFPGPVMALGPLGEGAALAVARNLQTGRYEAYKISVFCGR